MMKNKRIKPEKIPEGWLCLRFTHLSLNSTNIQLDAKTPFAVTDKHTIWQCNKMARASGIKKDMNLNHALMLCPNIQLTERDTKQEAKKLQELSYWAYRFTSLVCIYNTHTLLLEFGKSIILFKGLNNLLNLIYNDLNHFRIQFKSSVGCTPKAAYLLSFSRHDKQARTDQKYCQTQLRQCAISTLNIDSETIAQLHHCGFKTLDDIHTIPHAELGQRFGSNFLTYLKQLNGEVADPQISTTPPETFQARADFAEPITNLNWIQQQLNRLLHDLDHFITVRQLICRSFTWRFYQENNRLLQTVTIALNAKNNYFDTFRELTELKLGNIKLDWTFSSIELTSKQLIPKQLFNDDLFDPRPDQQQFSQLIDKLSNRLGDNALFHVHTKTEYLPELANGRQQAVNQETSVQDNLTALNNQLKDQPLWLLENPERLTQQHRQPHHQGPLNIIHGPDRITSHWWSKTQSRDYFIARQCSGRLLWIFFDRGNRSWYLQGLFA